MKTLVMPDAAARCIFAVALGAAAVVGMAADKVGMAAALLPLMAAVTLYAITRYQAALAISVFLLPLASTYLLPSRMLGISGLSPMNIIVVLSCGALVLHPLLRRERLLTPRWPIMFYLFVFLFVGAALHGAFYAEAIPAYLRETNVTAAGSPFTYLLETLLKPLEMLAMAYMLAIGVRNVRQPAHFLIPLFLSAGCIAGAVWYVAATSPSALAELASQQSRGYLSSIGMHANELGLLLNMAMALALMSLPGCGRRAASAALIILNLVLAGAVVLTFSRGAWLGLLSVAFFFLVTHRRWKTGLLAVLLVSAAAFHPGPVIERATQGMDSKNPDAISSGRLNEIWRPLLAEVARSPALGSGHGSILWSDAARQRQILPVGHPHSAFLAAILDVGLLGLILLAAFLAHMWRLFKRMSRTGDSPLWRGFFRGAMACVLLLLVQGLTDDSFFPTRTQPFLWLAYGCAVAMAARQGARQ